MSRVRHIWLVGLVLLPLACGGAANEHEMLGDRAYAAFQYEDALVEYRLALVQRAEEPGLLAKVAASALHSGSLADAAEAFRRIAAGGQRFVSRGEHCLSSELHSADQPLYRTGHCGDGLCLRDQYGAGHRDRLFNQPHNFGSLNLLLPDHGSGHQCVDWHAEHTSRY